jgi:signal transduction histidine kinase
MRERAEVLGGTVELQTGPGQGVRVTVELPSESAA